MTTTDQFPIPDGIQGFWQWDKMHFPRPLTRVSSEVTTPSMIAGFNSGMETFAAPVGFTMLDINTYGYMAIAPIDLGDETIEARVGRYQEKLADILPRMGDLWENEWLPSILPGIEKAHNTDYGALSDGDLLSTLDDMIVELRKQWTIHGRINFVTVCASWFVDFYNEEFSPEDATEGYQVLQGFPTKTVEAGKGLWRLRGLIMGSPIVLKAFQEIDTSNLVSVLEQTSEGKSFLSELNTYLDEFGWRTDAFELAEPTWLEDPTIPLNTLQGYIQLTDDDDPEVRYQEAVATRETLLSQAQDRLANDPEKLARLNELYDMARHYLPITENHNYHIDQVGLFAMRLPFLEIGRRLAERGTLSDTSDVFNLYLAEMREAMAGTDHRETASARAADLEKWAQIVPVPTIGEPPPHVDDPFAEAMGKMFGMPPEPSQDANVISGLGASPGSVQGRAKVVRTLSEASKLEKGDIMVCEMTMPAWTPLFSTVSAIVADTGGPLSHCAIVSREYRIPCVVGTQVGTSIIKDGMLITVDGSQGVVRIDSRT